MAAFVGGSVGGSLGRAQVNRRRVAIRRPHITQLTGATSVDRSVRLGSKAVVGLAGLPEGLISRYSCSVQGVGPTVYASRRALLNRGSFTDPALIAASGLACRGNQLSSGSHGRQSTVCRCSSQCICQGSRLANFVVEDAGGRDGS